MSGNYKGFKSSVSGTGGRDQRHTSDCVTVSLGIMKVANIIQNILKLYTRGCLVLKIYCNAVSNGKNRLRGDCSTVSQGSGCM